MKNSSIENKCTAGENLSLIEDVKEISSSTKFSYTLDSNRRQYLFCSPNLTDVLLLTQAI